MIHKVVRERKIILYLVSMVRYKDMKNKVAARRKPNIDCSLSTFGGGKLGMRQTIRWICVRTQTTETTDTDSEERVQWKKVYIEMDISPNAKAYSLRSTVRLSAGSRNPSHGWTDNWRQFLWTRIQFNQKIDPQIDPIIWELNTESHCFSIDRSLELQSLWQI